MFFDEIFLIKASRFEPLRAFMPMGYILFVRNYSGSQSWLFSDV